MNIDKRQQMRIDAARWLATLHSGEVDAQVQAEFREWQARDPEHARYITQLSERFETLQSSGLGNLDRKHLRRTLNAPSSRRQFLRNSLVVGATAIGATLLSRVGSSGFAWPGDLRTGIAERQAFELEDGSHLMLNASSRVTPRFADQQRGLVLQAGELLLDVRQEPRPFIAEVNGVHILARQQQLLLRHESEGCYAVAIDDALQLQTASGWQTLRKGHWARLDANRQWQTGISHGNDTLWQRGLFEADNLALHQVIDALRPYRRGILQLAPAAAQLLVSGLLPLDDSDHALAMLASIAPIRLNKRTDFWVSIEVA